MAHGGKVLVRHAGKHRDRDQLDLGIDGRSGIFRRLQHPLAAGGMDIEQRDAQPGDLPRRPGDGVGNIVELHVGEHRQAQRHDLPDTGGALRGD